MKPIVFQLLISSVFLFSCTASKELHLTSTSQLRFISEYDVPHDRIFQNTAIGGLSGIDYDRGHDLYYLICDDRSAINPARFYTARIDLSGGKIDSVSFVSVHSLRQPDGTVYPGSKQDPFHTPDPEALRYDPRTQQIAWSSEGERIVRKEGSILEDPAVVLVSSEGGFRDSFALPSNMHMHQEEKGPRQNGVFEGLSFTEHYKHLLVSVEEPLYEDGPRAGLKDSSAWIRLIRFNVKSRRPEAEYAYRIDPVAYPPDPPGAFKINGVPDILALNHHQLLVIERSFSSGRNASTIKIYLSDLRNATDVSGISSLKEGGFRALPKTLLLNMDSLGRYIDNIEGVTLGPRLPDGHQSLLFVSDNNFSSDQTTQFLLFEIW